MTEFEYRILQDRFSAKLTNNKTYTGNKKVAYDDGILACKSILKEIFERQRKEND